MLSDSPPERDLQWTETGIMASFKFINKLWELVSKYENYDSDKNEGGLLVNKLKPLINDVSESIERFQFNKSVAKIYEYVNLLSEAIANKDISKKDFNWSLNRLSLILQPFVPHISEEIWSKVTDEGLCIKQSWPVEKTIENNLKSSVAIQINGKTRSVIEVDNKIKKEDILKMAKSDDKVKKYIIDKKIIREIYVPGKIINFVV